MNLVPITYVLDEHMIEPGVFLYGKLGIEIDLTDGNPYIDSFRLTRIEGEEGDEDYEQLLEFEYGKLNTAVAEFVWSALHSTKGLMDDIFDECAREGMWG